MKKISVFGLFWLFSFLVTAQVVSVQPAFPTVTDEVTLTFDAKEAEDGRAAGLLGLTNDVFLWSGAGDNSNAFIYGPTGQSNFSQPYEPGRMTFLGNDRWQITLTPKTYFNIPDGSEADVTRLGLLLKNGDGSAQTEDLFVLVNEFLQITSPDAEIEYVLEGETLAISASGAAVGDWEIQIDEGSGFVSAFTFSSVQNITAAYSVPASGTYNIKVIVDYGSGNIFEKTISVEIVILTDKIAAVPEGIRQGINYHSNDDTKVTLRLLAPGKSVVYVVGDFNNWEINPDFQMNKDPDNENFWLELDGLTSGTQYVFQYWVDGTIKIGDPYADMVSDPWNDSFIPDNVHPNVPENNRTENQIATVIQTGQTPYQWSAHEDTWQRPPKEDLVIYELLIRDFIGTHYYQDLIDSLSYLKELGVNTIELMPIMEFEGNESWGYNPMYFFAPDKYYGTKNDLKEFIDTAHQMGFAVVLDMVLNHAFGLNAMVKMYWDAQNNKPSADSPWFNPDATHPFNVGFDFNHESQYTKDFVDDVNRYWIEEYHFDGYRFDLSKGFTQNEGKSPDDVGVWGEYDQSRVDILTRMANVLWETDPETYVILEHFGAQNEEDVLAGEGMLLWSNIGGAFRGPITGLNPDGSLSAANNMARVTYLESHDEQRLLKEVEENGAVNGDYNIKEKLTAIERIKQGIAFFYVQPGPKMMWQFQEIGYDLDINTCRDGVTIDNGCRVDNKPLPWGDNSLGYFEEQGRLQLLEVHKAMMNFANEFRDEINNGALTSNFSSSVKTIQIDGATTDIVIVGNFNLTNRFVTTPYTQTGTWFDYFAGRSLEVGNLTSQQLLVPGEFRVYTSTLANYQPKQGILPFIEEEEVTSIDNEIESRVLVYPNPGNDVIQVQLFSFQGMSQIEILNVRGESLLKTSKIDLHEYQFNVIGWPTGLYFIKVQLGENLVVKKLFIE